VTPDGSAILFLHVDPAVTSLSLQRVAVAGGEPVLVESLPYAPAKPPIYTRMHVAQLRCPRVAERACVLGATEGTRQVFYEVDPQRGRGRTIGSIEGPPPWAWDLAPSGDRVVLGHNTEELRQVDVASGEIRTYAPNPGVYVEHVAWIGDSSAALVLGGDQQLARISKVEPGVAATTLWSSATDAPAHPRVSSDGAWLHLRTSVYRADYWLRQRGD
jgi:hypothetical protein